MKLLAFETATEACSVALWLDGEVREHFEIAPRRHAELALPWAEQLLAEAGVARAQLDAVAVGRGPGAFTGVRLAIALGQGIALALDRPLVPVSTLATLAEEAEGDRVLAAIDARMGEVYLGAFARAGNALRPLMQETVVAPSAAVVPGGGGWDCVGTGFAADEGALLAYLRSARGEAEPAPGAGRIARVDAAALPRAGAVARLGAQAFARGEGLPAERVEPAYLRDNVALTLAEQQALRASR